MTTTNEKFTFGRSLNGNQIVYLARDKSGIVRFRESSQEKLEKTIKTHIEEERKKTEEKAAYKQTSAEKTTGGKKFLQNRLQKLVQKKKKVIDEDIEA